MLYSAMHQTNDGKIPIRTLKQALDKFEAAGGDPIVLQKATDYLRSMPEEASLTLVYTRMASKGTKKVSCKINGHEIYFVGLRECECPSQHV